MKFLSVLITFIVLSSSIYSDEDFDRFIERAYNDDGKYISKRSIYKLTSIIDLIENIDKITYNYLYEEGYNGPRYELQKKSIAASLSCQLAIELNILKKIIVENINLKKESIERHNKIIQESENVESIKLLLRENNWIQESINEYEFCLQYIEQLKQKHCNWAVEIESKISNI